jgi:NAD(P)H-flavin reductase
MGQLLFLCESLVAPIVYFGIAWILAYAFYGATDEGVEWYGEFELNIVDEEFKKPFKPILVCFMPVSIAGFFGSLFLRSDVKKITFCGYIPSASASARELMRRMHPAIARFMKDGFRLPIPGFPITMTMTGIIFLAANLVFALLSVHRAIREIPEKDKLLEELGKLTGVFAIMNAGLFLIPVSRSSVLLAAVGVPTEAAVSMHRWAGAYTIAMVVLHASFFMALWDFVAHDTGISVLGRLFPPASCWKVGAIYSGIGTSECGKECDCYYLWLNFSGLCCGTIFCLMGLTSISYMRRNHYKVFYFIHVSGACISLFVLCAHYNRAILWLSPSFAVYLASVFPVLVQALHSWRQGGVLVKEVNHVPKSRGCMNVKFARDKYGPAFYPGQWVRIHVPEISTFEWHPFSIASTADDEDLSIIFRSYGSWTAQFQKLLENEKKPRILVDGFYGSRERLHQCHEVEHVVLVGGGIGVTPLLSIIKALHSSHGECVEEYVRTKTVDLVWITRDAGLAKHLEPLLRRVSGKTASGCVFRVFIHQTGNAAFEEETTETIALQIKGGDESDTRKMLEITSNSLPKTNGAPMLPTLLSPINGGTFEACLSLSFIFAVVLSVAWLMYNGPIQNTSRSKLHSYQVRFVSPILVLIFGFLAAALCFKLALIKINGAGGLNDWVSGWQKKKRSKKPYVRVDLPISTENELKEDGDVSKRMDIAIDDVVGFEIIRGRPLFEKYFSDYKEATLAVFLCGPSQMCDDTKKTAIQECPVCDIYEEIFEL